MAIKDFEQPIGRNAAFLIKFNGQPFAGHDTEAEARAAVEMYRRAKPKGAGAKKSMTTAEEGRWELVDRTGRIIQTWNPKV